MVNPKLYRQNHTRSIHIHTDKKRKRKKMYISIYKKEKKEESNQINKHIYE